MIYAIAAVLVLIVDQWLKYWVTVNITLDTGSITLIPGVLELVNIHNSGAAFGILHGGGWRWVFVLIALAFIVIAVYAIRRGLIKGAVGRWAVVGMLAGAIGNCIDRVLYGYVVDMFKPTFLEGTFLGAIFNVADMFISCCGILFCIYVLVGHEYKKSGQADEEAEPAPRSRREGSASHARGGGSHAKGGRSTPRRVPAREARSERPVRPVSEAQADPRTPIPVQQPRPQRRSAPQQPRAIDPSDPFAEWEHPQKSAPQPQSASVPRSAEPRREAAQTTPQQPKPQQRPVSAPAPKPSAADESEHEFTLEEILAEFSDK